MHSIEVVLIMMLAVIASSYIVRMLPFSLPLPLVQIGLGVIIASITEQEVTLDPAVFFLLFLPPLLFLDGWRIPKEGLLRDKTMILELALGLVLFTVLGVGFLIHWMIPTMSLPVAFALAAIVSPTDPVAVSAITSRIPIPKRLMHILEGESLLNDATGLVCFRFAVGAAITGQFSLVSASLTFLWVAFAGLAIGIIVTWSVSLAQKGFSLKFGEDSGSPILINLLIPFGAYLIAEEVHASGILSAVSAGVTMSYVELTGRALATTRIQRTTVWNTVQFSLNGIVFVLLGEQFPDIINAAVFTVQQNTHKAAGWLIAYALAINFGLAVLRFVWVWISFRWGLWRARKRGETTRRYPHWRLVAATSLAGVRGTITLAGIMTLPLTMPNGTPFPDRDLALFLAMAVILVSLLAASLLLPWLLNGLQIPSESNEDHEEDLARYESAKAAITAIERKQHKLVEKTPTETELYSSAATRAMAMYQRRLDNMNAELDTEHLRKADLAERQLWRAGLKAERAHIFMMARERRISDKTSRQLVGEIDMIEARLESHK